MVGTSKMSSTWSWRLPLLLQIVPPIIVIVCALFCPESPRWLIQKGRLEEAKAILCKYHSNDGQTNAIIEVKPHTSRIECSADLIKQLELKEFQESIEVKQREPFWDYRGLFKDRNSRWRMWTLTLMCVNGQLAGNGVRDFPNTDHRQ